MADIVGKRERPESKIPQELLCAIVLGLVLCALQQFQIGLYGDITLVFLLNKACSLAVASLDPDEDVSIKYHGSGPREDDPFLFRQTVLIRAY